MLTDGSNPQLRRILKNFAALAALLALLLPAVSALTRTLFAVELPACCNTAYCPVHHLRARDLRQDRSNCNAMTIPGQTDCSMRACDAASSSVAGTAVFILVTPIADRAHVAAEAAPAFGSQSLPYVTVIPSTPPPRTFPD